MPLDPFDMDQISFFFCPTRALTIWAAIALRLPRKESKKKGAWKDQMINSEKAQGSGGTVLRKAFLYTSEEAFFSNDE